MSSYLEGIESHATNVARKPHAGLIFAGSLLFLFVLGASAPIQGEAFLVRDIETDGVPWEPDCPIGFCLPNPIYGSLPTPVGTVGGRALFLAKDTAHGFELWASDGTELGTDLLLDGCPGECDGFSRGDSQFQIVGSIGDVFLFLPEFPPDGQTDLWRTDGTPEGTWIVRDDLCGGSNCGSLVEKPESVLAGWRFFPVNDHSIGRRVIWRSDGTSDGTEAIFVTRCTEQHCLLKAHSFVEIGSRVFFLEGDLGVRRIDEDGEVAEVFPSCTSVEDQVVLNGELVLFGTCAVDGVEHFGIYAAEAGDEPVRRVTALEVLPLGLHKIRTSVALGEVVYFGYRRGLWRTDGTASGTFEVEPELGWTEVIALPSWLAFYESVEPGLPAFLVAVDTEGSVERLPAQISYQRFASQAGPPAASVVPTREGEKLVFPAASEEYGSELWVSDGTVDGTHILFDVRPGAASSAATYNGDQVQPLIATDRFLLFAARNEELPDGSYDYEPWAADLQAPPRPPVAPAPADDAAVPSDLDQLHWQVEGSVGLRFDVYLAEESDAADSFSADDLLCGGIRQPACDLPETLEPGRAYRWKVVARNGLGLVSEGETWRFETAVGGCPHTVCLQDGRFGVDVKFGNGSGEMQAAVAEQYSIETAFFWFFGPGNIELVVKVLDACVAPYDAFWVFAGGLTDVPVEVTVTDLEGGAVRTYTHAGSRPFETIADTGAFPGCGGSG